eukprot:scaffold3674_cov75-Cylindrotheca_fusiformis.AAC.4
MVTVGGGRSAAKKGRVVGITTAFWGILFVLGVLGNSVLVLLRSITADRGLSNASSTATTTPQITLSLANPNHYLDFIQGSLSSTTTVQQPNPSPTGSFSVESSNRVHNQRRERAGKAAALPLLQKKGEEENNDSSISGKSPILKNNNHTTTVNIAKPYLKHNNDNSNTTVDIEKSAFSFCLLIKDDNDIMNEWIAYHYHTLNLRTMIVSIDPDSKTTPEPLLQAWRDQFDLHYEIWDDSKYMPDWFLNGHFEKVPRMIKWQDKNASKWQEEGANVSLEERQRAVLEINKHRYRQAKFLQHCAKYLQENEYTWTTHIDTDEYIVINPTYRKKKRGKVNLALHKPNVVYDHLIKMNKGGYNINWPCISMPRVLYGSVEDGNTTTLKERFESLRWKFHAAYDNDELNKQPKAIMDVSGFPPFDETKKAFSIHRPSIHLCRMQGQMNVKDWRKYPLTINHYLGSLERYQAREDTRRTVK